MGNRKIGQRRLVILGNGGAGISAISAIRSVDPLASIVLVSSENSYAYSPVALTHYIARELNREQLFITDESFYKSNRVETYFGRKAIELSPKDQSIRIQGKITVHYDKLLIATGASPLLTADYRNAKVLALRSVSDADMIKSCLCRSNKAVILGGGLVSLQVADALSKLGVSITVLVSSNQVLSRNVDSFVASIVQERMRGAGIRVQLGTNVVSVEGRKESTYLTLDTGQTLSSPLVISGKGMQPNLLEGPLSKDKDMSVDNRMQTPLENVYAAGDVCVGMHVISNQLGHVGNWPNACDQGWVAGCNMAGANVEQEGFLNQNITKLFGLELGSIGLFEPPSGGGFEVIKWSDESRHIYRKIVLKEKRIVGATLVNNIDGAGVIRNLILKKGQLSALSPQGTVERFSLGNPLRYHPMYHLV